MVREIEVLENIKKEEESSDKSIKTAQAQAAALIEEAKGEAKKMIADAEKKAEKYRNMLMEKTKRDVEAKRDDILSDAKKRAQKIKAADKTMILKIFQKAIKERFGV